MLTADARARESAWALARRARAWTLAYSGMAMAARIPMMATTIINSMSVKPRWLPSIFRFRFQNLFIPIPPETLWPFGPVWKVELLLAERDCIFGATTRGRGAVRNLTVSSRVPWGGP